MANDTPMTCSLDAGNLEHRLNAIAEIGKKSLVSREADGDRHLLRFRADEDSRRQLEAIVVAEAECCAFLDLSLSEESGELILSVAAPENAQALADGLATAFAATIAE